MPPAWRPRCPNATGTSRRSKPRSRVCAPWRRTACLERSDGQGGDASAGAHHAWPDVPRLRVEARLQRRLGVGLAEAIALHEVDAGGAQEQVLLGGLHALGRHLHAEAAAEADDGVHDRRRLARAFDVADEAAVDLELVEREAPQVEQARIAGAEIVEREPD